MIAREKVSSLNRKITMKNAKPALLYLTLLVFVAASIASITSSTPDPARLQRTETINTPPKRIIVSSMIGGISHARVGLEVGTVLRDRGHQVTYLSDDTQLHLAEPYNFPTLTMGPGQDAFSSGMVNLTQKLFHDFKLRYLLEMSRILFLTTYERDLLKYLEYFTDDATKPDLVMCDFSSQACFEAANKLNIPSIQFTMITGLAESSAGYINTVFSDKPTSESLSIWERINLNYIEVAAIIPTLYRVIRDSNALRAKLGTAPIWKDSEAWYDSIVLVDGFFGLDIPRPVSPRTFFIGPVISQTYPALTPHLADFLDSHKRVAFVAFGQHIKPSKQEFAALFEALATSIENGILDTVLWAVVQASINDLPETVSTGDPSKPPLRMVDLLANKHPRFNFVTWAPQYAILNHGNTVLFITHGGASSVHEALYTGTRMIVVPYLTDQPANAAKVERAGVGLRVFKGKEGAAEIASKIARIIKDEKGTFANNSRRLQVLAQIGSRRVVRGADAAEEMMFASAEGSRLPPHLVTVDRNISWMKATNHDIYALFSFGVIVVTCGIGFGLKKAYLKITRWWWRWYNGKTKTQ